MSNRMLCDYLEELRTCDKTKNYSSLSSIIEEIQFVANRMESALYDKSDIKNFMEDRAKLKDEVKALKKLKEEIEVFINPINTNDTCVFPGCSNPRLSMCKEHLDKICKN